LRAKASTCWALGVKLLIGSDMTLEYG